MKISIKDVNNPFQTALKQNVSRFNGHYHTTKKQKRISLMVTSSYKVNDDNEDKNYYENLLRRINDNNSDETNSNVNDTAIFPPSSTKNKHLRISYNHSMNKKKKEKSCKNLHANINNGVKPNNKLTKSMIIIPKSKDLTDEHMEEDVNRENDNNKDSTINNNTINNLLKLHQEKLNVINEENNEDITMNANSKISFKKSSKTSFENLFLRPGSNKNTKKVILNVESGIQIEIHPVKRDTTLSLFNQNNNNQIENSSVHTMSKPINPVVATTATNKEIKQRKLSEHSQHSSNSFSSIDLKKKKKRTFLCCIPIP